MASNLADFLSGHGVTPGAAASTDSVPEDSFDGLEFILITDEDGFVDDVSVPGGDMAHYEEVDDFLMHYGVKGMKWGVRRNLQGMAPSERQGYINNYDSKWLAKVEANPKLGKVARVGARYAKKLTKKLKADYKTQGLNIKRDPLARARYDRELKGILEHSLDRASHKVHGFSPSRLSEVQIHRHPDGTITAIVAPRHNAKIVKQVGKIARSDARAAKRAAKTEHKTQRPSADSAVVKS